MKTTPRFDLARNLARQSLYRFAALSLLDPRAGAWERLDALRNDSLLRQSAKILRDQPAAGANHLAPGELSGSHLDPKAVLRRLPQRASELNDEYEATFGLLVAKACPPYETEYIQEKFAFQRAQALADVAGFYRAFGLRTSEEVPQRDDHVVLEMEFLALLVGMERRALCGDAAEVLDNVSRRSDVTDEVPLNERAAVCRDAQRRFLKEHVAWWVPAFCKLVGRENVGGFYEAAAQFIAALIPVERAFVGIEAGAGTVAPSIIERPEECEGCLLSGV